MQKDIKNLYIFEGFKKDFLNKIMQKSKIKNFKKGELIVKEGDIGEEAYIIITGMVSVFKGDKNINTIFEGDIFGEISLVINEPRTATVFAETDLSLIILNKDSLLEIIKTYPNGEFIKNTILNRIIQNTKKLS